VARRVHRFSVGVLTAIAAFATVSPVSAQTKHVEVLAFQGGYGIDFFQQAAKEYNTAHPGINVTVSGSPRAWEIVIPRLASGTPPDLVWAGWGMNLAPVISEGQALPWDQYLDQPAYGESAGTWRETFQPDLLKKGEFGGKTYVAPFNIDAYGWWYDKKLFEEKGWTAPTTYEEFLVLGEKIKAENIAPLTFTGRYPIYLLNGIYYPWVVSAGGLDVLNAALHLEPGAWKHPAFLKAAHYIMDLKRKSYFQGGCIGMNHTESQMELLVHRAAMIPCGSWIQSEMKDLLPPGFEMTFTKTPVFKDGTGDPTALFVGADGKGWFLPAKGNHPDIAADFYRYLSSPEKAAQFIEAKGTMTAIKTKRDPKLLPHLTNTFNAFKNAKTTYANDIGDWHTQLETEVESAVVDMYNELITPEQFILRLEEKTAAYRARNKGMIAR